MTFEDTFADDIQEICAATLGGAVSYQPKPEGGCVEIQGIWSAPFVEVGEEGGSVASRTQTIDIRLAELREKLDDAKYEPKQGDVVIRKGVEYTVYEDEPDGQGAVKLFLHIKSS